MQFSNRENFPFIPNLLGNTHDQSLVFVMQEFAAFASLDQFLERVNPPAAACLYGQLLPFTQMQRSFKGTEETKPCMPQFRQLRLE